METYIENNINDITYKSELIIRTKEAATRRRTTYVASLRKSCAH